MSLEQFQNEIMERLSDFNVIARLNVLQILHMNGEDRGDVIIKHINEAEFRGLKYCLKDLK